MPRPKSRAVPGTVRRRRPFPSTQGIGVMHNAQCTIRSILLGSCILHGAFFIAGCSIPAIESADCTDARNVAKRYYSLAIGGDLEHQPDAMREFKKLLAPDFSVSGADATGGRDPYDFSLIMPSSSRFDEC